MPEPARARLCAPYKLLQLALLLLMCSTWVSAGAAPRRIALLIGVGQYADAAVPALEGPAHDIAAMRAALQQHWGFEPADIEVLQDRAATRAGILAALQRLQGRSASGDQVFVYFSGHGTSAKDKDSELPLPHTSGAFIPHDLRTDQSAAGMVAQLIVGQSDLQPLLARLDAGGRRVFVVSDSCYSGQAVRALGPRADGARLVPRHVPLRALAPPAGAATRTLRLEPVAYPYRQVFYIAAASDSEQAMDIGSSDLRALPTVDGRPHGALTDALLRVLAGRLPADRNRDGALDHGEVYAAVAAFMAERGYPHTPQALPSAVEDVARLAHAALFDTRPVGGGFVVPAAVPASAAATIPAAPHAADTRLRVRVDSAAAAARDLLAPLDGLALLAEGAIGPADFSVAQQQGAWQLRGPAGDLVLQGTLAQLRTRLQAALWLRRLQQRAAPQQRFQLELQALPSTRGGSFVEGERFTLALRSQRNVSVLLLAVDPQGAVTVLYPHTVAEKAPHAADAVVVTPPAASPIVVTPPFGTDELLALAFEQPPAFWPQLPQRGALAPGSPLLQAVEAALAEPGASVAAAGLLIRSLPRLASTP